MLIQKVNGTALSVALLRPQAGKGGPMSGNAVISDGNTRVRESTMGDNDDKQLSLYKKQEVR